MNQHDDKLMTASSLFLDNFNNREYLKHLLGELTRYITNNIADPSFEMSTLHYYTELYMKIEERVEFLCQYLDQ